MDFFFFGHLSDSFCVFARGEGYKIGFQLFLSVFPSRNRYTHTLVEKCAIKIILRNRCEKPRRGLIHFLYLFSSIFPLLGLILLPLLYFFKKSVCYAPTHFLLDFVAHYKSQTLVPPESIAQRRRQ